MAKTERAKHLFAVKEGDHGRVFLALEQTSDGLASFKASNFFLDLRPGTTIDQAREISRLLNENVDGLAVVTFNGTEGRDDVGILPPPDSSFH